MRATQLTAAPKNATHLSAVQKGLNKTLFSTKEGSIGPCHTKEGYTAPCRTVRAAQLRAAL